MKRPDDSSINRPVNPPTTSSSSTERVLAAVRALLERPEAAQVLIHQHEAEARGPGVPIVHRRSNEGETTIVITTLMHVLPVVKAALRQHDGEV